MSAIIKTAGKSASANEQLLHGLRQEFDTSFTRDPAGDAGQPENFLVLKIAGDAYALRVTQISGLYADKKITLLPSPLPELSGMAGFRGQVTPVYDLASLLGYPRAAAPKWITVLRHPAPVAVAFEEFHAHLSVAPAQITASSQATLHGQHTDSHLQHAIQANGSIFPIIHVQSILKDIQQRVTTTRSIKER
ncbi:MAG: chemotaxis protein CheW [Pseudomonadota bacterium]